MGQWMRTKPSWGHGTMRGPVAERVRAFMIAYGDCRATLFGRGFTERDRGEKIVSIDCDGQLFGFTHPEAEALVKVCEKMMELPEWKEMPGMQDRITSLLMGIALMIDKNNSVDYSDTPIPPKPGESTDA